LTWDDSATPRAAAGEDADAGSRGAAGKTAVAGAPLPSAGARGRSPDAPSPVHDWIYLYSDGAPMTPVTPRIVHVPARPRPAVPWTTLAGAAPRSLEGESAARAARPRTAPSVGAVGQRQVRGIPPCPARGRIWPVCAAAGFDLFAPRPAALRDRRPRRVTWRGAAAPQPPRVAVHVSRLSLGASPLGAQNYGRWQDSPREAAPRDRLAAPVRPHPARRAAELD
jgi:hypothetical protein